jgi:MFS transporter, Spinster family, sphingosine-1-phosphate transporter
MPRVESKNYVLAVLTIILMFNYVDRLALGVMLQDIKVDLQLSDTQLGVLSGIAFALFYSVMGVPIARWADRGNRVTIISLTAALWSAAVALCGMAGSFLQLLFIRVGVAVGEAGCIPPAFSLMADYFTRAERPRAAAIYGMGAPLSFVVGYFLAGWLNEFYGWRITFMVLGLPGLILAALARFTLREPRLNAVTPAGAESSAAAMTSAADQPSFKHVCATLWANETFCNLLLCLSVIAFFNYGILQWQPSFFIRSYGMETGEIGTWLAVTYGIGGLAGTYLGGELASRHAASNEQLQLKAMAFTIAGAGIISVVVYLSSNQYWAFALTGLYALGLSTINGPLYATIQTLVPERMRAVSFALVFLSSNLIGMGLGPMATGAMSDAFRPWAGEESLRYALLMMTPGYLWAGWYVWRGSRTVTRDLANAHADFEQAMSRAT